MHAVYGQTENTVKAVDLDFKSLTFSSRDARAPLGILIKRFNLINKTGYSPVNRLFIACIILYTTIRALLLMVKYRDLKIVYV